MTYSALPVISAGKVNVSYTLMVGVFGIFFLIFPSVDMKLRAKRQRRVLLHLRKKSITG